MTAAMSIPVSRFTVLAAIAAVLLGGCGNLTKSTYQRPLLDMPAQWRAPVETTGESIAQQQTWWQKFGDPQLDALIDRALRTNNDLAAAAIRLYSARLQSSLTDTNLTPDLTISGSRSNARNLTHGGATQRSSSTTTSIDYEIDLWGRLARLREASRWEAEATEYDRRAAALTLIGTTATLYWQIAALNGAARTIDESVATTQKTLHLVHVQHEAGEASEFEEAQARAALESLNGDMTQIVQQLEADRNALAILFDQAPSHREPELDGLAIRPMPALPSTLPANLLGRRPDLQAAEARLRETLANADATRVSFYPTFSLFGSVGTSGVSLSDILKNPVGTLGTTLSLPFVEFNTANLTIKSSKATFDLALVNFRQTFYQALSDTESAIAACAQSQKEVTARKRSLDASRSAETLAAVRYRAGNTSLTDWLDLQQSRQNAEIQLEQAVYNQYVNQLTLYLALGGDLSLAGD